jgi:hypothetical protein
MASIVQNINIRQGTAAESLLAFFDSSSYEDAIRNAVLLGGESDPWHVSPADRRGLFGGIRAAIRANVESMPPPDLTAIADHFRRSYSAHFPDLAP